LFFLSLYLLLSSLRFFQHSKILITNSCLHSLEFRDAPLLKALDKIINIPNYISINDLLWKFLNCFGSVC